MKSRPIEADLEPLAGKTVYRWAANSQRAPKLNVRFPVIKDSEGRNLCRWDQKAVAPPRRSFCSDECVHEVSLRTNHRYRRAQVRKRDKGVCQACGADTLKIGRVMRHAKDSLVYLTSPQCWPNWRWFHRIAAEVVNATGWHYGKHQWEADHVVELAAGGDSNLGNMATLCCSCHRKKTSLFVTARALERRERVMIDEVSTL